MHKPWVEMLARGVHESFEGGRFEIGYIFEKWNYTREQKIKCRDDLASYMTERDHPDTDILWTVLRHKLERKRYKSTTKALQETLQEAWETGTKTWLDLES
jgi:hypothetical protein